MEVYLNLAETGIGTYGVNAGSQRYFDHDASAMSRTEAARIAAVLPLPKKRGAVAPKGFTRRYGSSISARIGVVGRDGLDACVYEDIVPPKEKAPPATKAPKQLPGEEYRERKAAAAARTRLWTSCHRPRQSLSLSGPKHNDSNRHRLSRLPPPMKPRRRLPPKLHLLRPNLANSLYRRLFLRPAEERRGSARRSWAKPPTED